MHTPRVIATSLLAVFAAVTLQAAAGDLRLVHAGKQRDMAAMRSLLKQRVEVNTPDVDGMTPLHWAAHWDELEIVKLLLAAGANPKAANRYGVTPLHEASLVSNVPMMEALLKAGAQPNVAYGSGETPLMTAARTGNVNAVKLLAEHGADINAAEEYRGQTALMFAAAENHAGVVKFLIDRGAQVNARSAKLEFGDVKMAAGGAFVERAEGALTPLFFAARQGAIETGQVLIAAGADLNASEAQYGFTPLLTALFNGHYDFAGMLIEKGADVNDGSLYLAMEMRNLNYYNNRPNPPDKDKNLRSLDVVRMLLERGANPNAAYSKKIPARQAQGEIRVLAGYTPLLRATKSTDLAAIRLLMEKGANPAIPAKDGSTPLMVAAGQGAPLVISEDTQLGASNGDPLEAVQLFVKAGADVNAANDQGFTAMHYAAQTGRNRIVEFLAVNGARLDVKNKAGRIPLDLAAAPGPTGRYLESQAASQVSTAALIRKLMGR
jgi:ankyrin repeat protein